MNNQIKINNKIIGHKHPAFLIAEAGVNHNGNLENAKKMIDIALASGADAVKFQTFNVSDLILQNVEKASYQKVTTSSDENQFEMLKKLEINKNFHQELINYCNQKGIMCLSTPYDEKSLELLLELDVPAIKIASTDTTNLLFLEKIAKTEKPIILSTGMCNICEIEQANRCLRSNGCHELALLKCTSNYPTEPKEVNLNAMLSLATNFDDAVIGFSDHTSGVGASPYAVAMGAKIVEKHFTIDKTMEGPDHRASLDPDELKTWVKEIRHVEQLLGDSDLSPANCEKEIKKSLQKSIVSKTEIKAGEVLSRDNLTAKRTGGIGIPASMTYEILGKKSNVRIEKNTVLHWNSLKE